MPIARKTPKVSGTSPLGPLEVEKKLERAVPDERKLHAHHWLILHGRYVCKARKPDCPACIVQDLCAYKAKTTE